MIIAHAQSESCDRHREVDSPCKELDTRAGQAGVGVGMVHEQVEDKEEMS
jgi:hypothetical protein